MTRRRAKRLLQAVAVLIAWGVFAFGAVYPWAYWPLAAGGSAVGVAAMLICRGQPGPEGRALRIALALLGVAIALQLVPLPAAALAAVSPATVTVLRSLHPAFAVGLATAHPLSIHPASTYTALALFAALVLLLLGTARLTSLAGPVPLLRAVALIAVAIALIGIVQKPLYSGRIYGWWTPQFTGTPFGPFVNKNHFAGWMLMALPLVLALLAIRVGEAMRGVRPSWHSRLMWAASPEASRLLLLSAGAALMAVSIILSMSRSGVTALGVVLLAMAYLVIAGRMPQRRKLGIAAYLAATAALTIWIGGDAIAARFGEADLSDLGKRRQVWSDTWRIARDFPVTGTGLNTYWSAMLLYQTPGHDFQYEQAHSDYLQLASEGGWLLGGPILACVALFARAVRARFREDSDAAAYWARTGAVVALLAIAVQEVGEFSLQMPGNAVLFAVVCGIALHRGLPPQAAQPPRRGPQSVVPFRSGLLDRRAAGH